MNNQMCLYLNTNTEVHLHGYGQKASKFAIRGHFQRLNWTSFDQDILEKTLALSFQTSKQQDWTNTTAGGLKVKMKIQVSCLTGEGEHKWAYMVILACCCPLLSLYKAAAWFEEEQPNGSLFIKLRGTLLLFFLYCRWKENISHDCCFKLKFVLDQTMGWKTKRRLSNWSAWLLLSIQHYNDTKKT